MTSEFAALAAVRAKTKFHHQRSIGLTHPHPQRAVSALYALLFLLMMVGSLGAQTVAATLSVGTNPTAVAVNPVTNKLYVTNCSSNNVTVIDGATNNTTTINVGAWPSAMAVNTATNKIYVVNTNSDNVTVIDGATNETTTVSTGSGSHPYAVAVNPVTNKIYVANNSSGTATVIDGATNTTTTVTTGNSPYSIAINPVTNKVYVANWNSATVTVIDGVTNNTTNLIVGPSPTAVAVNPVTNRIYVTPLSSNYVTVIDGATSSVTASVTVGMTPAAVAINPVTNKVYVATWSGNSVTIIDGATNTTTSVAAGTRPSAVAVNPVANKIYITNYDGNSVTVIDGVTNITATLSTGMNPAAVAVNPVSDKIYIANRGSNSVTVIDGDTNGTATLGAGTYSWGVAVNPVTNKTYVANYYSNSVTVVDGATKDTTTVSAGVNPRAVAVNPITNKIYVANYGSNNVTVIDGATNSTSTVGVGGGPVVVAVNPVTNRIYVPSSYSTSTTVIDGATNNTTTVTVGSESYGVAVNPMTNKIYVTNYSSNNVTVIDGLTNTTSTVSAGFHPWVIAVNSVTNKIYVANANSYDVTVIDGATNSTTTVGAGRLPSAVAVNPVTNKIYVANPESPYSSNVTVIDGATNSTATIGAGAYPQAVAVNPATNKIYVANISSNNVTVIDGATNATTTVSAGSAPQAVAVNPITNQVYLANANSNNVTVITPNEVEPIPLAATVQGMRDSQTLSDLAVFATSNRNPSFTTTVTSSFSPIAPAPTALYYQLDTAQGIWQQATATTNAGANPANYTFSLTNVPLGVHTVFAYDAYGDEGTVNSSCGGGTGNSPEIGNLVAYTFAILPIPSTTTLAADVNPQVFGQSVTFTAYAVPQFAGADMETGTVTFLDGANVLGQQTLDGTGHSVMATSALSAGSHTITASYSGDVNYLASSSSTQLTIERATPVITWLNPPDITYGTSLSAAQLNATASVPGSFTYSPAGGTVLGPANGYMLHVDFVPSDTSNYNNASLDVQVNVLKASVSPHIAASDKIYDGSATAAVASATLSGVVGSDDVKVTCGAATFADKNAGTGKIVTATGCVLSGAVAKNYTLSSTTASTTASITARLLHATATALNRAYDGTIAASLLVMLADDRIPSDVLTFAFSASFADKNVGVGKPVSVTGIAINGGADQGNYTLANTTASTTATITQRTASATPNAAAKTYGAADPTFTGALSGFVAGDNIIATYSRTAGETVAASPYTFSTTLSPAGALGNYNITYNTAAFTINKAALSVTVNNQTRAYGAANPPLNGTLSGVANNDAITPAYATTAIASSDAGTYPIGVTLTDPSGRLGNYTVTNTPGTLTIVPASTTAALGSNVNPSILNSSVMLTATILATPGTPTGTVTFKDGSTTLGLASLNSSGAATYITSALSAGQHLITAVYGGTNNYAGSTSPALTQAVQLTLTVNFSGMGTVSSTDRKINCTNITCQTSYDNGTSVTLTATPAERFMGWSGACFGTGTCTLTLNSHLTVAAAFNDKDVRHRSTQGSRRALSTGSLAFLGTDIGTNTGPQTVVLTNSGDAPLLVSDIRTVGNFRQSNNCGSSLGAGKSCTIAVVFQPATSGTSSGQLVITDNSSSTPGVVVLSGDLPVDATTRQTQPPQTVPSDGDRGTGATSQSKSGPGNSQVFTPAGLIAVSAVPPPTLLRVESVTPAGGKPGTELIVRGSGFGPRMFATFSGVRAKTSVLDSFSMKVIVPELKPGNARLAIANDAGETYTIEIGFNIE